MIPVTPDESLVTSDLDTVFVSSILNAGESCAAAKPNLATFENNFLSPTVGGLDDITVELPNAYNRQQNNWSVISAKFHTSSINAKGDHCESGQWSTNLGFKIFRFHH